MVRASFFIFGYRRLLINKEDMVSICAALMRRGVTLQQISECELLIPERAVKCVSALCEAKYEYSLSVPMGLWGRIKRTKYKRGVAIGLIISLILTLFLQNLVWDIRIDGANTKSKDEIKEILSSCGLEVGSAWNSLDRSAVEADVLASDSGIAWININRRGTIAYIEIKEREGGENDTDQKVGYANLVAKEACVIEELTVRCGVAMVKPGDVVKKGDILISGISRDGSFCFADGDVFGRVSRRIEVSIPRLYEKEVSIEKHFQSADVKIFNFLINIFKKYGNSYPSCDIIEDIKVFSLFGTTFPIALKTTSAVTRVTEDAEYSDEELAALAIEELSKRTNKALFGSDLLKIQSGGEFGNQGYSMYSDILMLTSVGEALEFYID